MIKLMRSIVIYFVIVIFGLVLRNIAISENKEKKEIKNQEIRYKKSFLELNNKNNLLNKKIKSDNIHYEELKDKYNQEINKSNNLKKENVNLKYQLKRKISRNKNTNDIKVNTKNNTRGIFKVSAYDLSIASCGKSKSHPQYGITASGRKAVVGRTIAVDPRVIPLGTKVYIRFNSPYSSWSGYYIAEDTGGAIKGNRIDLFIGENRKSYAYRFGIRNAEVAIIK